MRGQIRHDLVAQLFRLVRRLTRYLQRFAGANHRRMATQENVTLLLSESLQIEPTCARCDRQRQCTNVQLGIEAGIPRTVNRNLADVFLDEIEDVRRAV